MRECHTAEKNANDLTSRYYIIIAVAGRNKCCFGYSIFEKKCDCVDNLRMDKQDSTLCSGRRLCPRSLGISLHPFYCDDCQNFFLLYAMSYDVSYLLTDDFPIRSRFRSIKDIFTRVLPSVHASRLYLSPLHSRPSSQDVIIDQTL